MANSEEKHIVRLRGLPWAVTETQIIEFLDGVQVLNGEDGVHKTFTPEGKSTGEAYVEVVSADDVSQAVMHDKGEIGSRYIEVFRSSLREMEYVLRENDPNETKISGGAIVKLRGLPFNCSKEEIAQFFSGLEIVPNGITLVEAGSGRGNGECFVEFSSEEIADKALGKNKEKIGHRYIEIFKSSATELTQYLYGGGGGGDNGSRGGRKRSGPYDRPAGRGRGRGRGSGYPRGGGRGGGRRAVDDGLGNTYYDSYNDYTNDYYDDGSWGNGGGGNWGSYNQGGTGDYGLDDGLDHGGFNQSYNEPDPYNQPYNSGPMGAGNQNDRCIVRMRGLPYRVNEQEVHNFFNPILPISIEFGYGNDGRMTGEATAVFSTPSDAQRAMQKDKQRIQHRYIELFMGPKKGRADGGRQRGGGGPRSNNSGLYTQY